MAAEKDLLKGEELLTPRQRSERLLTELIEPAAIALKRILELNPMDTTNNAQAGTMRTQFELSMAIIEAARGIDSGRPAARAVLAAVGSDAVNREMMRRLAAKQAESRNAERAERRRIVEATPAHAEPAQDTGADSVSPDTANDG